MRKKGYDRSVYRALALISQCGINMIVPVVLCGAVGVFLDRKLGTSWWTVILFFVGALAGLTGIFRMIRRIYVDKDGEADEGAQKQV